MFQMSNVKVQVSFDPFESVLSLDKAILIIVIHIWHQSQLQKTVRDFHLYRTSENGLMWDSHTTGLFFPDLTLKK